MLALQQAKPLHTVADSHVFHFIRSGTFAPESGVGGGGWGTVTSLPETKVAKK